MIVPTIERFRLPFFAIAVSAALVSALPARAAVDFSRDILPILSDKCYHCHGPDAKARKANLRFDTKEGAFRLRKGKSVIVPGNSAASELVRRITTDEDERMPPPESNRTLTAKQIDLLKKWVEERANNAAGSPKLLARDPGNQLLARAPIRRLTAKMLRDQALAVSGLLTEKIGGPSVKPYQLDGLWSVAMGSPRYDRSRGPDLYRRRLYTFWKRTVPQPAMVTFDAAERNVCIVRRQSTSTLLQALALLNDPQIVEAARFLGQCMLKEGGKTSTEQVGWVFRTVTGRSATDKEVSILARLLAEQKELFKADPKAATKLLAVGDGKNDAKLDTVELAAGTVLALMVLNHDEAVMRR